MLIDHYIVYDMVYEPILFSSVSIYGHHSRCLEPLKGTTQTWYFDHIIIEHHRSEAFRAIFASRMYSFCDVTSSSQEEAYARLFHLFSSFFLHLLNDLIRAHPVPGASLCAGDTAKSLRPVRGRTGGSE